MSLMPRAVPPKPSRSGTPWTEEQRVAAGWVRRTLRLRTEDSEALDRVASGLGVSLGEAVGRLARAADPGKPRKKRGPRKSTGG